MVDLATGKRTVVHKGGAFPRWSPSGHVLFARKGTIYAAPFDIARGNLTGRPVPVLEKILSSTGGEAPSDGSAQIDVSASGVCVYRTGEPETLFTLAIADRKGEDPSQDEPAARVCVDALLARRDARRHADQRAEPVRRLGLRHRARRVLQAHVRRRQRGGRLEPGRARRRVRVRPRPRARRAAGRLVVDRARRLPEARRRLGAGAPPLQDRRGTSFRRASLRTDGWSPSRSRGSETQTGRRGDPPQGGRGRRRARDDPGRPHERGRRRLLSRTAAGSPTR